MIEKLARRSSNVPTILMCQSMSLARQSMLRHARENNGVLRMLSIGYYMK